MTDFNYSKINAWPFSEACRVKSNVSKISNKKTVNFETGYGPSGDPHIGTFAEVLRTNMIRNCLDEMCDYSTELITFSDDLDALRKVPEDYPHKDKLTKYIDYPLSSIPDFTEQYKSYADRNNSLLKKFLDRFNFKYKFISSTENYKEGRFNKQLLKIIDNYESILNIVLPTLRKERRESYSPFLPISKKTNKVLQVPIKIVDRKKGVIAYKEDNKYTETLVTDGNCKLQWKVDWAMRWSALDIDYEMNGKDLIPSFELSKQISKYIDNKIPINMSYELFLDDKGEKISKSRGNGLSIEQWIKYGSINSLSLFMYNNPKRAKKLYFDCIPKNMDDYKKLFESYKNTDNKIKNFENPMWHIHEKKVPNITYPIDFSTLLNLVTALNSVEATTIKDFIKIYINFEDTNEINDELNQIINLAINYYKDFILPNIKKRKPNDNEKKALAAVLEKFTNFSTESSAEDYQKILYNIGKDFYPNNLREWFTSLYQIFFGSDSGPRLGSFFKVYGKDKVLLLIEDCIK